ncbi:ClpXP protease specificity-enhancing factor [Natronospira bacteriovora]|uniref:ClpXP protease specificity-enhancing factor n=1 Tax=Natronospira bacteriovora TaxID=3069753 RepID=A0ABU0W671_9GAMM|nr:ClpXP protease specificity-enhancing factor [Natronospira sp. AB-CW4]MDQ2069522.1 ClpXP protease specificity-enhancing factor [Natronospira sp. AB-CW4]
MISRRPYLIRAMHEWMVDNGETPHLLVDAEYDGVEVPTEHVQNGKIILNISPSAVQALSLANEGILFNARFGGQPRQVSLPIGAVLAIYSRESGQGMLFSDDDDPPPPEGGDKPSPDSSDSSGSKAKRPNLRVIK